MLIQYQNLKMHLIMSERVKNNFVVDDLYEVLWSTVSLEGVDKLLKETCLKYHKIDIYESLFGLGPTECVTFEFLNTSEEEKSKETLEDRKTDILDDDVTYDINRYGMRSSNIDILSHKVDSLVFGCSFSYGIGVPLENTWPDLVNQYLGQDHKLVNLSIPGCSISKLSRVLYTTVQYSKPTNVFILFPHLSRDEIIVKRENSKTNLPGTDYTVINFIMNYLSDDKELLDYIQTYLKTFELENYKVNAYRSFQVIKHLTDSLNINLYVSSWCPQTYYMLGHVFDEKSIVPSFNFRHDRDGSLYARDGAHPGKRDHKDFADNLIKCIDSNNKIK